MSDRVSPSMARNAIALAVAVVIFSGCATQAPPIEVKESTQSLDAQKKAKLAVDVAPAAKPTLKRKIALGRISNETNYGRSLLRDSAGDPLGKQVSDLLGKALTDSGSYLVFERPDIDVLKDESKLVGSKLNLIGVDVLVVGSLTEFGRKTVGQTGFVSDRHRQ